MADKRITELNELTTLVNADELIVSDTSATETKKITVANFKTNVVGSAHTVQNNGTGLTQRANLNFDGTHVVASDDSGNNQTDVVLSANLQAVSGLTSAADKGIQFTGSGTAGVYDLTAAGKALLDDANAAAQRTTLGLGALSTEASVTTSQIAAGTLVTESETIGSNDNDTTIPTSAAVKAYADSVGGSGNKFQTIAVSGQSNVVADSSTDTLTLAAGSNVTLTTNAGTDTVTIAASGGGGSKHVIQNNGTGLTERTNLNFDGTHVIATDDSGNNQSDITLSTNLQAISGLTSAADKGIQFTGTGTASVYDLTAAGKALLDDANASAQRTTLGLAIGTNVQAYDADLAALAGLTSAADKGIQFTGSGTAGTFDLTTAGKALLDDANASAQRTTLGLAIGTNVQAHDADLAAIAGLTSAADKGIQFTGSGTAGVYDLTAAGKALLDDADAAAQRTTLGLGSLATLSAVTTANITDISIPIATASDAAGQTLLYDGSNSYDNKQIKVMQDNSAFTTAFPMIDSSHIFRVTAVSGSNHYTFSNYNSDGTDQNDPSLYLLCNHTYAFYLSWGGSHPFAIRTGASSGGAGTNLSASNGGDNLVHIATNGTVTTGTSANAQTSGWLIWQIPNFSAKQNASTGNYGYQCTSHAAMFGQIYIGRVQDLYGSW